MNVDTSLAILALAGFVGVYVIGRVPNTLHTPLMAATNAIHGIVLVGGLLLAPSVTGALESVLDTMAITFGAINVVGGFLVTDRMLQMFTSGPTTAGAPTHRAARHETGGAQ